MGEPIVSWIKMLNVNQENNLMLKCVSIMLQKSQIIEPYDSMKIYYHVVGSNGENETILRQPEMITDSGVKLKFIIQIRNEIEIGQKDTITINFQSEAENKWENIGYCIIDIDEVLWLNSEYTAIPIKNYDKPFGKNIGFVNLKTVINHPDIPEIPEDIVLKLKDLVRRYKALYVFESKQRTTERILMLQQENNEMTSLISYLRTTLMSTEESLKTQAELMEQVNQVLQNQGDCIEIIYIINLADYGGKYVSEMFTKEQVSHIAVNSFADTKFVMVQILNRLRRRSSYNNKNRICLLGSDCHLNNVLRVFVDQINRNYSEDIVNSFTFFLIPITGFSIIGNISSGSQFVTQASTSFNNMARRLCSVDPKYASLFSEFIQVENHTSSDSTIERDYKFLVGVKEYLKANGTLLCPIGDCLVESSVKPHSLNQDCESSAESFIPFLCEVRLDEAFDVQVISKPDGSMDYQWQTSANGSPPRSPIISNQDSSTKIPISTASGMVNTLTSVPVSNSQAVNVSSIPSNMSSVNSPPDAPSLDLQLDYWTDHSGKILTLKSSFRQVLVNPMVTTAAGTNSQHSLTMIVISKEKKQKITKNETGDSARETIEDIVRILCTSKIQNSLIRVTIDGVVWTGVKVFQLNPSSRTLIKYFPIATFNHCA